ncbi:ABC transporter permease subunit [Alicyclobacillus curvatus]|nr:ABC transporter permease subunit [Alicyclobacillus curvatus]
MKIYRRTRTWILAAAMVALIVLTGILYHHQHNTSVPANWKQQLVTQNTKIQQELSAKHNPGLNNQQLEVQYKTNQYHIEHNIPPSATTGWDFANLIVSNMGFLVTVFVAVIAGDIVASEFSFGTIKALLIRPVKRWQVLLSKFIAALIFGVVFTALTFVISYVVGGLLFGFGGAGHAQIYVNGHQTISEASTAAFTLMNYGFMAVQLLFTMTIAFMISSLFRSSALAIAMSIVTLFVGSTVVNLLSRYSWDKYILFANTDLSQYFINGPHIHGMTLGFSIVMLAVYFVVMKGLSYVVFGKRDVSLS